MIVGGGPKGSVRWRSCFTVANAPARGDNLYVLGCETVREVKPMRKYLGYLGYTATDRITNYKGVVETIAFDLYGCVQAALRPPMNDKGEITEGRWFDVNRLVFDGNPRVMTPVSVWPEEVTPSGPADKPRMR